MGRVNVDSPRQLRAHRRAGTRSISVPPRTGGAECCADGERREKGMGQEVWTGGARCDRDLLAVGRVGLELLRVARPLHDRRQGDESAQAHDLGTAGRVDSVSDESAPGRDEPEVELSARLCLAGRVARHAGGRWDGTWLDRGLCLAVSLGAAADPSLFAGVLFRKLLSVRRIDPVLSLVSAGHFDVRLHGVGAALRPGAAPQHRNPEQNQIEGASCRERCARWESSS